MILQMIRVGPLAVNCYIVGDDATREVIVIDPGGDVRLIYDTLKQLQTRVTAIVLTHAHFDHLLGVDGLAKNTGAPLFIGKDDAGTLQDAEAHGQAFGLTVPTPPPPSRLLDDGETLLVGSIEFKVITTPGHTPGGICLWVEKEQAVFTGDTLLRAGIGRTDRPGGSMPDELRSIRNKLLPLPPETRVYPGHGPVTTIGEEKAFNPFLQSYV